MDIHRLRIVPYPASPINALAFSHESNLSHSAPSTLRLALGRANGDLEIWNPDEGRWVQERIFPGSEDRSIEGLVWTQDPVYEDEDAQVVGGSLRLFSIGYSGAISEWNIALGAPKSIVQAGGSEIWCLAVQPRNVPKHLDEDAFLTGNHHQQIVAGCANGTLVLFATDGDLKYRNTLPPPHASKAKVMSVTWQNAHRIIAGYSDNAIRVYDTRGRPRMVHAMSLAPDPKQPDIDVLVWAVRTLPDGTIVSGDSSGEIKIWDAATLSLVQRVKSHNADILTISPSVDGTTMLSGGIDRRTVTYRRITSGKGKGRWTINNYRRLHASDVKVMASYEAKDLHVVVSGGLDATPIVLPRTGVGLEHHRRLAVHPNLPPLQSARSKRLIMSYWGLEIRIWRVDSYGAENSDDSHGLSHALIKTIKLSARSTLPRAGAQARPKVTGSSITSASLTTDGSLLAASTATSTRVFRLLLSVDRTLSVHKMVLPSGLDAGSNHVEFSPDQKWLYQSTEASMKLWRICWDDANEEYVIQPKPVQLVPRPRSERKVKVRGGTHGDYLNTVQRIAWSSNSCIFVTCDLSGRFDSWALEGIEDLTQTYPPAAAATMNGNASGSDAESDDDDDDEPAVVFGQRWVRLDSALPRLGCSPLVLSFRPDISDHHQRQLEAGPTAHPTRNNPQPVTPTVAEGEDRLIAVSAAHQIVEYHVMQGALTAWSRRNPRETQPQEFQNIRERAMGCVWDVTAAAGARLWLYGSSWLWMFDLSVDMSADNELLENGDSAMAATAKKRKRDAAEDSLLMKNTSGAGSRIPPAAQDWGMMPAMLETEGDKAEWVPFEGVQHEATGETTTTTLAETTHLVQLRRGPPNGTNAAGDVALAKAHDEGDDLHSSRTRHWGTFKYRPILGIVPLDPPTTAYDNDAAGHLEVALVERPLWDTQLPERWEGDQEWKK